MAQLISYHSGSYFFGNPILYSVRADSISGTPVFHRVVLEVSAALNVSPGWRTIRMSEPVESGQTVEIDISSALRSVADGYEYTIDPPATPIAVSYTLRAWDEYMIDGDVHDETNGRIATHVGGTAYPGRLNDRERLNVSSIRYRGTCKPSSSPEIVVSGQTYMRPSGDRPPFTITQTVLTGLQPTRFSNPSLYALPASTPDCYEMCFVNRYGCHETVTVVGLLTSEVSYDTADHVVARQETIALSSRGIARKRNDRETWHMSSHPLDRQWQRWFLHEFLTAEWSWIRVDGVWLQVHILPGDSRQGIDRQKAAVLAVEFDIRFDIEGSPFAL